jgi:hypothetical protein
MSEKSEEILNLKKYLKICMMNVVDLIKVSYSLAIELKPGIVAVRDVLFETISLFRFRKENS